MTGLRGPATAGLLVAGAFLGAASCGDTPQKAAARILRDAGNDPMELRRASVDRFSGILSRTRCWCCKETLKTCFEETSVHAGCPPVCKVCLDEGRDVLQMIVDGKGDAEIFRTIDARYQVSEPPAIRGTFPASG